MRTARSQEIGWRREIDPKTVERILPVRPGAARTCARCGAETTVYGFLTPDGLWLETHHCPTHGAVMPVGEAR